MLVVNRVPPGDAGLGAFFDVQVQFPARTLRFSWRGQRVVEGRTRLQANVWHHVVAQAAAHGGCEWCGRLTLYVNGAQDHVWGYVQRGIRVTDDEDEDEDDEYREDREREQGRATNDHLDDDEQSSGVVRPRVFDVAMLHGHPGEWTALKDNQNVPSHRQQQRHRPVWDAEFARK